jgi:hypothetical protein
MLLPLVYLPLIDERLMQPSPQRRDRAAAICG